MRGVRNSNLTGYKTITDSFYLPLIIQRAVQNWLVRVRVHKTLVYFCLMREIRAGFGIEGMDRSFLRILSTTAFL